MLPLFLQNPKQYVAGFSGWWLGGGKIRKKCHMKTNMSLKCSHLAKSSAELRWDLLGQN